MKRPTDSEVLDACRKYVEAVHQLSKAVDALPNKRYDEFDPRRYKPENRVYAAECDLDRIESILKKTIICWHTPAIVKQIRNKASHGRKKKLDGRP